MLKSSYCGHFFTEVLEEVFILSWARLQYQNESVKSVFTSNIV
jgi:hypothetical protein